MKICTNMPIKKFVQPFLGYFHLLIALLSTQFEVSKSKKVHLFFQKYEFMIFLKLTFRFWQITICYNAVLLINDSSKFQIRPEKEKVIVVFLPVKTRSGNISGTNQNLHLHPEKRIENLIERGYKNNFDFTKK